MMRCRERRILRPIVPSFVPKIVSNIGHHSRSEHGGLRLRLGHLSEKITQRQRDPVGSVRSGRPSVRWLYQSRSSRRQTAATPQRANGGGQRQRHRYSTANGQVEAPAAPHRRGETRTDVQSMDRTEDETRQHQPVVGRSPRCWNINPS